MHFLEIKEKELILEKSNRNDIIKLLGPPSTRSLFDNDLWIYIERKTTSSVIKRLGKKELLVNNVLLVEIDNTGILVNKNLLTKNDIENYRFTDKITTTNFRQTSFVYNFLASLREKVNDPLGKKRKRISD